MKKLYLLILLVLALGMGSCVTYYPIIVNETSQVAKNFKILGPVYATVVKSRDKKRGPREILLEVAREKYGEEVSTVIDITVTIRKVSRSHIYFEGYAIRY